MDIYNYKFNYNGDKTGPIINEKKTIYNIYLDITTNRHIIIYTFSNCATYFKKISSVVNYEDIILLTISTFNSAHSISEILSFLNYYSTLNNIKVAISNYILVKLPFLYQFLKLFISNDNIIILDEHIVYFFNKLLTYRNDHFNFTTNWIDIQYSSIDNNILEFKDIQYIKDTFLVEYTKKAIYKVQEIYNLYKTKYNLYDNIMIIKTIKDTSSVSIERAMTFPNKYIIDNLEKNNIKFIQISDFKDIYEYICIMYHAKNIIFSYGGPACTNRLFCNPESNIIVLGNTHYRYEYYYNYNNNMYWHIRHSHLFPVKSLYFILEFENELTIDNLQLIYKLIK